MLTKWSCGFDSRLVLGSLRVKERQKGLLCFGPLLSWVPDKVIKGQMWDALSVRHCTKKDPLQLFERSRVVIPMVGFSLVTL